jgi:hypothetical protein
LKGPDGSGKTTLSKNLVRTLTEDSVETICTREPGGTDAGNSIRELVLRTDVAHEAKLCLFYADRLQHLHTVVVSALRAGKTVISDRSELSTYSYQVHPHEDAVLLELFQHMSNQVQSVLSGFQWICLFVICHMKRLKDASVTEWMLEVNITRLIVNTNGSSEQCAMVCNEVSSTSVLPIPFTVSMHKVTSMRCCMRLAQHSGIRKGIFL